MATRWINTEKTPDTQQPKFDRGPPSGPLKNVESIRGKEENPTNTLFYCIFKL
jgi:hypothetical protein